MGLSKKTFLYSIIIAGIMVAFVTGYFVLMLPSLYVDYVMKSNLKNVAAIQRGYMEEGSYDGLVVKNPSSAFTLEIPDEGKELYVAGKFLKLTVEIQNEELLALLNGIRGRMNSAEGIESFNELFSETAWEDAADLWAGLKELFASKKLFTENYPVDVQMEWKGNQEVYREEYEKLHMIADDLAVYEAGVSDGNYSYTTYMALGHRQGAYVITILPAMTPRMDEITPVVMGSLPMIIAVVFLLILISSHFFSGKIVNPIIRLAGYTESAKLAEHFEIEAFEADGSDEIGSLGRTIQELYEKLRDNYLELEEKNRMLKEENVRQEVFLRASSHQLKTPVSAALLLVDGMINEVGKYKNTKEYLPQVKSQLLAMRKIVEDILYLNHHADQLQKEGVAVELLTEELLRTYAVQIEDKSLEVKVNGSAVILTDREAVKKIMDNLLANAVAYTPQGERIEVDILAEEFCIKNYGVTIEEKLLPNVFEPFVSSCGAERGRGLGLYVAAYYSRLLGYKIKIENMENGVCASMNFHKKKGE